MFDFGFSADQIELKDALSKFLDSQCAMPVLRKLVETPSRFSPDIWRGLAEIGLTGLVLPEAYGGLGRTYCDLMALFQSVGRAVVPAPCLETVVVGDLIVAAAGEALKARYLPAIVSGDVIATYAVDEPTRFWTPDAVQCVASECRGGFALRGRKLWVPFSNVAQLVVCLVRDPRSPGGADGLSLLAIPSPALESRVRALGGIDETYQLCEVDLDGLVIERSNVIGQLHQGWMHWAKARRLANLLASAELIGVMERCIEIVVAYAKERVQFGKPIGSYQAVKHRCADMLTLLEATRGTVMYAAWSLDQQAEDCEIAVSAAKAHAADAAVRVAESALQTLGAIGFTWEHDIHFYLKRAKRLETTAGDASFHREVIAGRWLTPVIA